MRPALPLLAALVLASGVITSRAEAQDRARTERRLGEIRSQIAGVEREVRRTRSVETGALRAVEQLGTEIALREELVREYRTEVSENRRETESIQRSIGRLQGEIKQAKTAYRARARHAYMHGRRSPLALLLSSSSINQMLARARYLQQFASRRRRQVDRVAQKSSQLQAREAEVVTSLEQTRALLSESQREQEGLDARKRDHQTLIAQARSRRGELERELRQRRADASALTQLVADLRAEERREAEARRRAEEERRRRAAERLAEAERQRQAAQAAEAERRAAELSRQAMTEDERRTSPERRGNTVVVPAPEPEPVAEAPAPEPEAPPLDALEDRTVALTGSFQRNRGGLPWPVDGTITGAFGNRRDPVTGTTVNAVGVDIASEPGAAVRSVFEGTVERVGTMATFGTFVMVSHGEYTTVYGNLSQVNVRGGQRVRAGQALGRAGTGQDRRGAALFFAVFQGNGTPLNPASWLGGR